MTQVRREWLATFMDPAVLSDLRKAVCAMAAEIDDCDPEECMHPEALVHPIEVFHWIERELHIERGKPVRIEPAGRPNRKRDGELRLNLAATG